MNYTQKTLLLILFFSTLLSCNRVEELTFDSFDIGGANMLPPENIKYLNYYKGIFNSENDMGIDLQSTSDEAFRKKSTPRVNNYQLGGHFPDNANKMESSYSVESINVNWQEGQGHMIYNHNHEYISDGTPPLSKLFGKTVTVKFNYSQGSNTRYEDITTTFYVPKELVVTNPVPEELGIGEYFTITGTTLDISWEPDENNEHGLLIGIKWDGETVEKPIVIGGEKVQNIKLIDDDGQFTITEEFFEGIPRNTFLRFFIIRGNIVLDEVNGQIIELKSSSTVLHSRVVYE
ncbi:MAG: hypothetical protein R2728_08330 [Chitinophagales bacterium]